MVLARRVIIVNFFFLLCSFQSDKVDYIFRIGTSQNADNLPKDLTVEIINNESSTIKLHNLVFDFYIDDDGYWATYDKSRFVDYALLVKSKKNFKQTISIDSLTFTSFDNSQSVSTDALKKRMKYSKLVKIKATIDDMRNLENPLSSSSLTHSNVVELKVK